MTSFSHLVKDYKENTGENDLSHLEEILLLHDLEMDKAAGTFEEFKKRSLKNFRNRALHHHIFSIETLNKMFEYIGLDVIFTHTYDINHIIFGQKISLAKATNTHNGDVL